MNRYESYKTSGVEWLGEVPSHWEVKKLKHIGYIYSGLTGKSGDDFSKEHKNGFKEFIPFTTICNFSQIKEENFQYVRTTEIERQNIVQKNDLLFLMSSETLEDIAKSSVYLLEKNSFLNSFCKGFRISSGYNSIFVNYLIGSKVYRNYFNTVGRGFTRVNIKQEYINNIPVIIPSILEQQKIAQYLDDKTAKIDQAIMLEEKQIELLKEHKQILIQNAVTKGLNPQVKFKDSGVEWLGEVPEHWEVENSKWIFAYRKEKARKDDEQLTASQKHGVIPQKLFMEVEERRVTLVEFNYEILKHVEKGDFVISMRSFQGGIEYCDYTGCVSSAYVALIPSKKVYAPYYKFLLKSSRYIEALQSTSNLVRDGQALRYENFCMVILVVPPLSEQTAIAQYLDEKTAKIDHAIQLKQQQIDKLKEYKMVLINDVVTGKVKVA